MCPVPQPRGLRPVADRIVLLSQVAKSRPGAPTDSSCMNHFKDLGQPPIALEGWPGFSGAVHLVVSGRREKIHVRVNSRLRSEVCYFPWKWGARFSKNALMPS